MRNNPVYLLGLAFIAWIACGGLVLGYFVEYDISTWEAIHSVGNAITEADNAAKAAQKAIDDHEAWVANERRKNAEVIQRARKAARGHNG